MAQVRLEATISPTARPNCCVGPDDALTQPTAAEQSRHGLAPAPALRASASLFIQQVRRLPPTPWYHPAGAPTGGPRTEIAFRRPRQAARSGRRPDPVVLLCQPHEIS